MSLMRKVSRRHGFRVLLHEKPFKGVNWLGLISWACGTAFGMVFKFLIPTINAVIVAMIVYFILIKLVKSEKVNPFCHN